MNLRLCYIGGALVFALKDLFDYCNQEVRCCTKCESDL